jgi:biotin operon repressor
MKTVGEILKEQNLQLDTLNPVLQGGFTQIPNFILKDAKLSVGAKIAYAMFLSYAWHNDSCFPGQDRLAEDMGLTRVRVTQLIAELEQAGLVTIQRRGQGKTNIYRIHFQVKQAVDKTPRGKLAYFKR